MVFWSYSLYVWSLTICFQTTSTLEHLSHLVSKPGVQSTLILSRLDGSIIHTAGLLAQTPTSTHDTNGSIDGAVNVEDASAGIHPIDTATNDKSAESIAHKVFTFVSQAQGFAEEMAAGDEVRLLRLRTKRQEIVIYPGSQWSVER